MDTHTQGDSNNFLYLLEKTRNVNNPICNNKAVYLLSKANPIVTPAKSQYPFLFSKMALLKQINESVQNKINGTSGVELKLKIDINMVVVKRTSALFNFGFERKIAPSL